MLTQQMCSVILPLVDDMMKILGLKVLEVANEEKLKIEQLIDKETSTETKNNF